MCVSIIQIGHGSDAYDSYGIANINSQKGTAMETMGSLKRNTNTAVHGNAFDCESQANGTSKLGETATI